MVINTPATTGAGARFAKIKMETIRRFPLWFLPPPLREERKSVDPCSLKGKAQWVIDVRDKYITMVVFSAHLKYRGRRLLLLVKATDERAETTAYRKVNKTHRIYAL